MQCIAYYCIIRLIRVLIINIIGSYCKQKKSGSPYSSRLFRLRCTAHASTCNMLFNPPLQSKNERPTTYAAYCGGAYDIGREHLGASMVAISTGSSIRGTPSRSALKAIDLNANTATEYYACNNFSNQQKIRVYIQESNHLN